MKTFNLTPRCLLLLGAVAILRSGVAQEISPTPPTPPPPAADVAAVAAVAVVEPLPTPGPTMAVDQPGEVNSRAWRRLDETAEEPAAPVRRGPARSTHRNNDRVSILGDTKVNAGEHIVGDAVAVLGNVVVDGDVARDAVCVLGDSTINGTVHGQVVCVLGDVHLGPQSHVMGDVVSVGGGDVARAAGAVVEGRIIHKGTSSGPHISAPMHIWWSHALALGRPLAFVHGLNFIWLTTACLLAFYVLLTLMFPVGIRRTGDVLAQRPIAVVFSAVLATMALPVLFVLLCVTVVGIPVAIFILPLAAFLAVLFGKAAIYSWIGRRLTQERSPLPVAMLLGALIFIVLFFVPVLGLTLWFVLGGLGLGCAVTAMFQKDRKSAAFSATPTPAPIIPGIPTVDPKTEVSQPLGVPTNPETFATPPVTPSTSPLPPTSGPPIMVTAPILVGTPAGFWIRTGALLIDFVLGAVIFGAFLHVIQLMFVGLAAYGAVMWKLKESTIGGIICGLRVVRLDGKPLDWTTTVVRALGCFVSMLIVGLGFVWVAFDDDKQSWHDKIAGTTVVRAPRGRSLV